MKKQLESVIGSLEDIASLAAAFRTVEPGQENDTERALQLKVRWGLILSKEIEKEAKKARDHIQATLTETQAVRGRQKATS